MKVQTYKTLASAKRGIKRKDEKAAEFFASFTTEVDGVFVVDFDQVLHFSTTGELPGTPTTAATHAKKEILRKSEVESPCRLVWDLADKMEGARRKDVMKAAVDAGVAFYTARTQYQLWKQAKNA